MKPLTVRKLHRKMAPILFLPLCISAITGVAYYLGKNWFGIANKQVGFLLSIHQGSFLGDSLKPTYVLLVGLGLVGLIVTGVSMVAQLAKSRAKTTATTLDARSLHRVIAPIFFFPLALSAVTGVVYRLGKSWFGLSAEQAEVFVSFHVGEYLGDFLSPIYVLLLGLGLIALLTTGLSMTGLFRRRPSRPA